eukprot:TRINITY_DN9149_c0_g1_i1.p1 TRINITY_DN9149_c0_g1~~TRINITY_DN9149_c0_g1_i1.p1  ORF type:complete len:214 (+),score=80.58 TRINITY_DN9149_c0_g1_i1:80-721(+)
MSVSALIASAKRGDREEAARALAALPPGADLNLVDDDDQRTPLHWAVSHGWADIVAELIEKGAGVDTIDEGGYSPLMTACAVGREECVDLVLGATQRTVDERHRESNGKTAFFIAVSKGREKIAAKLLAKGADVNAADASRQTPLHRAVIKGNAELVEWLVAKGAQLNAQDSQGDTPLHYAAIENNKEIGSLLIRAGADKEIKNREGKFFHEL